jgi:hypothetical protein
MSAEIAPQAPWAQRAKTTLFARGKGAMSAEIAPQAPWAQRAKTTLFARGKGAMSAEIAAGDFSQ